MPPGPDTDFERRRVSFGAFAELYDRARPGYPQALFESIASRVPPPASLLEIGCGTGKATVPLAQMGYSILALEPAPGMAEIARRRLASFPKVRVEISRLEDWPLEPGQTRLAAAGQAFHWIDPATGYPKLVDALGEQGLVAAFWNLTDSYSGDFYSEAEALFARHAVPFAPDPTMGEAAEPAAHIPDEERQYFEQVEVEWFPWFIDYTSDQFVDLQRTHSHYVLLTQPAADAVLNDLHALIETRHGGHVGRNGVTLLRWLRARA